MSNMLSHCLYMKHVFYVSFPQWIFPGSWQVAVPLKCQYFFLNARRWRVGAPPSTSSWTNPPAFPGVWFLGKTPNKVPRTILLVSFVNAISPEGLERIRKHILCAYAHTRAHTGALRSLLMLSCVWLRLFTTTGDHLINQYCGPAGQCFRVLAFGDGQ